MKPSDAAATKTLPAGQHSLSSQQIVDVSEGISWTISLNILWNGESGDDCSIERHDIIVKTSFRWSMNLVVIIVVYAHCSEVVQCTRDSPRVTVEWHTGIVQDVPKCVSFLETRSSSSSREQSAAGGREREKQRDLWHL